MTSLPHRDAGGRPRIAIVHDYFTQRGGAERVVGELVRLFPDATVHTSVFDAERLPPAVARVGVRASGLQPLRARGLPLPAFAPLRVLEAGEVAGPPQAGGPPPPDYGPGEEPRPREGEPTAAAHGELL